MYTNVARVFGCSLLVTGVLVSGCGDDGGTASSASSLEGRACTLNQQTDEGCRADGSTMCELAGGNVVRVCYQPGTRPTLGGGASASSPAGAGQTAGGAASGLAPGAAGAAPGAGAAMNGVWSECCCHQPGSPLYCPNAEARLGPSQPGNGGAAGTSSASGCGNGQLDPGEMCDGNAFSANAATACNGGGPIMCTPGCTLDTSMCATGPVGGTGG